MSKFSVKFLLKKVEYWSSFAQSWRPCCSAKFVEHYRAFMTVQTGCCVNTNAFTYLLTYLRN